MKIETVLYVERIRDSLVSIVTCYGLEGAGIESQWGRYFPPTQTSPGAHPASYTMGTGYFPGVKRPGCGVDHPPPSSSEVKERVELYLYSHSGTSYSRVNFTLLYFTLLYVEHLNFCISSENVSSGNITFLTGKTESVTIQVMKPKY